MQRVRLVLTQSAVPRGAALAATLSTIILLGELAWASGDAYYRTLMPPLPPITPVPVGQAPLLGGNAAGAFGRLERPRPMVIMSDRPRQAAMTALENPSLSVTLANQALSAGLEAERQQVATCVDLYFEAVTFSWHFMQVRGSAGGAEFATAWQLYHHALARLVAAGQRFGRLDPGTGLRVNTAVGPLTIPTSYRGFVWRPEDFTRVEVVTGNWPRQLNRQFACPGLGVPLVVIREHRAPQRFLDERIPFGATVVLRPSLAVLAGTAPPLGADSSHGPLEFHDPLRVSTVAVGGRSVALATDTSAHLEYAIRDARENLWQSPLRRGTAQPGDERLALYEPRQPGKYPLILVHGVFSSPIVWAQVINEIQGRRDLRDQFQIMTYRYPASRPFLESAAILRRELNALVAACDPQGSDPAMANMVIVGHSGGGLLAKLMVTRSDDRLWMQVARRPIADLDVPAERQQQLREWFCFEPLPFVRRAVFLGTPHDGATLPSRVLGRLRATAEVPSYPEAVEHDLMVKRNPDTFHPPFDRGWPDSLDMMRPDNELLLAIQTLCPSPYVQLHNVVGFGLPSLLQGAGDGVVSTGSALHPCVSTEKWIRTAHGGLHEKDEAIEELQCILSRHTCEALDPICVVESEPEYAVPHEAAWSSDPWELEWEQELEWRYANGEAEAPDTTDSAETSVLVRPLNQE
jgi:pimeloyl-ACP methyl ester carboxylesterase